MFRLIVYVGWLAFSILQTNCSPAPIDGSKEWLAAAKAREYLPKDRVGHVCCSIQLINSTAAKDTFNSSSPKDDITDYKILIRSSLESLRAEVNDIEGISAADNALDIDTVTSLLVPDVITIDLSLDSAYPNGRLLTDNATDTIIAKIFDRKSWSDGVDSDFTPLESFPFLINPLVLAE